MFLGEYEHSLDQKGRIAIPSRFRNAFVEGIVLARGYDRCIIAYPLAEWKKLADKLSSLSVTRGINRRINRSTFSSAFAQELDGQGRVLLPPSLRDYAQIKDGVIIAGVHNYLEIWGKELWGQEREIMEEQSWKIAEAIELAR